MGKSTKSKVVPLRPANQVPVASRPEPKPRMQEALQQATVRNAKRSQPIKASMETPAEGRPIIGCPHNDVDGFMVHLRETFGSGSNDFAWRQLGLVRTSGNASDEEDLNAALAFIGGIQPNDQIEAALAVQMLGTHEASVRLLATAMKAGHIDSIERYVNMATKMQRTFTAQVEAMKRYRSSGEQTIRVQHQNVTVESGGQAIIGDVQQGGGRRA